jgi:hypothetical protein
MESIVEPSRPKRGCLWYLGVTATGAVGLLMVFIVALVLSPDEPGQSRRSIPVSAQQQTYLEVVTHSYQDRRNGEGFLADYVNYTVLAIYYTKAGSWFQAPQRVLVFCGGEGTDASTISIRRRMTSSGQFSFEIKRPLYMGEIQVAVHQNMPPDSQIIDWRKYSSPDKYNADLRKRYLQIQKDSIDARIRAKDSVLLTVFIPPAVFPEEKAKQANFDNDCRSTPDAPKPASELLNIPRRLGEALRPLP